MTRDKDIFGATNCGSKYIIVCSAMQSVASIRTSRTSTGSENTWLDTKQTWEIIPACLISFKPYRCLWIQHGPCNFETLVSYLQHARVSWKSDKWVWRSTLYWIVGPWRWHQGQMIKGLKVPLRTTMTCGRAPVTFLAGCSAKPITIFSVHSQR